MCISKKIPSPKPQQPTSETGRGASVAIAKRRRTMRQKREEKEEPTTKEPTTKEQKEKRKQIISFLITTLEKGILNLRSEFARFGSRHSEPKDFENMPSWQGALKLGKNRYKDCGCLEETRVKLSEPWPHDYIHANYVATPSNPKRFICTQAPLEKTCADFWFMCLQDRVEVILMLCNLIEKGARKCYPYYPTDKEKPLEFKEGEQKVTVKFESSKEFKFKDRVIRNEVIESVFSIEGPDGSSLRTTHYHFTTWIDREVPAVDMAILELLDVARVSKNPIVVHGSAGLGRAGTLVMIEYMMDQFLAGQPIEEGKEILKKLREQRHKVVQTDLQYLFVHEVILNYFEKKRYMNAEFVLKHQGFQEQYNKCCR